MRTMALRACLVLAATPAAAFDRDECAILLQGLRSLFAVAADAQTSALELSVLVAEEELSPDVRRVIQGVIDRFIPMDTSAEGRAMALVLGECGS